MREVAHYDYNKALVVECWPLVEVLHAFEDLLKARALRSYHHSVIVWAILAPHTKEKSDPPKLPSILDD